MSDVKPQLRRLLRIQELAQLVRQSRAVVDAAPMRIEEIEAAFRERNAEYVALKTRFEELDLDRRTRTQELQDLEEARRKYTDQLMQVKNQREYSAVLKEIDAVKAQTADHEDAVLQDMQEIETLTGDLEARSAHIQEERDGVARDLAQVEAQAAAAREDIIRLEQERVTLEHEMPADLIDSLRRIEGARAGLFMAKADGQVCQSCFVRIRPQVYQEIKLALRIHACSSCRRFLYYEAALKAEPGAAPEMAGGPTVSGLGAVNGGAV